jgi:hypothetical protein
VCAPRCTALHPSAAAKPARAVQSTIATPAPALAGFTTTNRRPACSASSRAAACRARKLEGQATAPNPVARSVARSCALAVATGLPLYNTATVGGDGWETLAPSLTPRHHERPDTIHVRREQGPRRSTSGGVRMTFPDIVTGRRSGAVATAGSQPTPRR